MFWLLALFIVGIISYIAYKKKTKSTEFSSDVPQHDHAIIIGGSIGGMATAAYLSKYFSRITIIESDDAMGDTLLTLTPDEILDYRCRLESPTSIGRSGVPQIYQLHAILVEGHKILRELFPRLDDRLLNEYNVRAYSLKNEMRLIIDDQLLNQNLTKDIVWLGVDRFTLEAVMRSELWSQFGSQIEWRCKSRVTKLIVDHSQNIVKGITYRCKQDNSSSSLDLYGNFIVDCSGRNSSSIKWLKESVNLSVPSMQIHFGCGYVTFIGERFKTGNPLLDRMHILASSINAPHKNTGCIITPMRMLNTTDENSLATLATIAVYCVNSEFPPNDSYEHLLEWAKENLDSEYYSILKSTKVYSPLVPYHRAINDRKYVELLGKNGPKIMYY